MNGPVVVPPRTPRTCHRTRRQRAVAARSRANGFVSAVLLVLLLATSGWPVDNGSNPAGEPVACQQVGSARQMARAEDGAERAARPRAAAHTAARPRTVSRQRRVDTYGLPPPRAPTA